MIKLIKEEANIYTLEPIGTLIYQIEDNLRRLSSTYANADDLSSRINWTDKMKNQYNVIYEKGLTALQELRSCTDYMVEFEAEAESNS